MNSEKEYFGNKKCPSNCIGNCDECYAVIKKLKALNIINDKEVDVFYIKLIMNAYDDDKIACDRYNERMQDNRTVKKITYQEFKLLKEVLKDE